ncbi:V-type ATP synthase subunit I domain-containing protein [Acinetobacter sp. ANC 4636]
MKSILEDEFINLLNDIKKLNSDNQNKYINSSVTLEALIKENVNKKNLSNFTFQENKIKSTMINIEKIIILIEQKYIKSLKEEFSGSIKNEYLGDLISSINHYNKIKNLITTYNDLCKNITQKISEKNNIIKEELESYINKILEGIIISDKGILDNLDEVLIKLNSINKSLLNEKIAIEERKNLDYQNRFMEDAGLLLKKYENEIKNLTSKYENEIKNLKLDQDSISKSSKLLQEEVDNSLKKLTDLNERTQKVELEFSKIIHAETSKIRSELDNEKHHIFLEVNKIVNEVKQKSNELETAHSDFKMLVERAGIYELTRNYKEKADEEKKDYVTNRRWTVSSISLAIVTTIIVISLQYKSPNNIDYYLIFARLSISIMFFVLAVYTSKQAAKHYECYQENHRTFLQLAALEPFMARMTHDEQKEIRKGLIPSYFNQGADGKFTSKGDEVDIPANMASIMGKLVDIVAEKKDPKSDDNTPAAKSQS